MRLFLQQNVEREEEATPPFLTDREEDVRFNLLRESTLYVKEGKNRLPTPEKNAIMELSTSFEKRRLGKQQQILSEMTQRCREQEVTDLSSKISAKCDLKLHGQPGTSHLASQNPFYSSATNTFRASNHRLSDSNLITTPELHGNHHLISPRTNVEKTYKFFPARRIMRQPTKIHVISTNLPKLNSLGNGKGGRHPGEAFVESYRSPRYHSNLNLHSHHHNHGYSHGYGHSHGHVHEDFDTGRQRRISHPMHSSFHSHNVVHRSDPLAPLVLPRLHEVDPNYQDRIDSYFSSTRLTSVPRKKTFYHSDGTSISGPSYHSMLNLNGVGQENYSRPLLTPE